MCSHLSPSDLPSDVQFSPARKSSLEVSPQASVFAVVSRQPHDYSARLPQGWNQNIHPADSTWIGHSLFVAKGKLTSNLQMWWHPPPFQLTSAKPSPESYNRKRLFLWMPRKMWRVDFQCPVCCHSLRSKGLYNRVRMVMDVRDFYYLAAEYMECGGGRLTAMVLTLHGTPEYWHS